MAMLFIFVFFSSVSQRNLQRIAENGILIATENSPQIVLFIRVLKNFYSASISWTSTK